MKPRWKIVIVAIILAATITLASLFYFWWASPGVDGLTPAVLTSKVPVTGGWQINIVSVTKTDIPWDQIKVQLNDGTDSVGWSIKTTDLDGGANITAPYAAKLLGTLSVTLTVTDNSGNGYVSGRDYLTFTADPVFSSTITYTVVLMYEPTGEQMCAGGITFTGNPAPTTPAATYGIVPMTDGGQVNIASIDKTDVPWDHIKVQLSDGTNFAEWQIVTADLTGGSAITMNYGALTLSGTTVWLNVTDVSGNGFVNGGDYFRVTMENGPFGATAYSAVLVYVPTGELMGTGISFTDCPTPAATYSKAPVAGGEQVNIVSITKTDVAWDLVKVQLSDGTSFAEWETATADLDGGSAVTAQYGAKALGVLTVYLNVTDVGGNGFVSGSDYFRLTANPLFSTSTTYTAVLVYVPTGERIGTGITFNG